MDRTGRLKFLSAGITPDRLVLEITEGEVIDDHVAFGRLVNEFRRSGLQLAIDDFGAGYAGLTMLADFQPDLLKLDMTLVRGIEGSGPPGHRTSHLAGMH